jgi:hypothetical protein
MARDIPVAGLAHPIAAGSCTSACTQGYVAPNSAFRGDDRPFRAAARQPRWRSAPGPTALPLSIETRRGTGSPVQRAGGEEIVPQRGDVVTRWTRHER